MAKIFFDANFFISLVEQRRLINISAFASHELYISPLSIHILCYLYRYKIPYKPLTTFLENFNIIMMDSGIAEKSLIGPTNDFEDNVQLHSAAGGDCGLFLTEDRSLLKTKFFGKLKIVNTLG